MNELLILLSVCITTSVATAVAMHFFFDWWDNR